MKIPYSGTGMGFRRELLDAYDQCDQLDNIDFFELAPENWIELGGRFQKSLRRYTERFPFACHGLSLSIGSSDPLDTDLLKNIKSFMQEHRIELYTEHLSWCSQNGHLYDLLPVPFTEASARWVAERVKQVQETLETTIALENSSYYFSPSGGEMSEPEFINFIMHESGCKLHLDVNNLYVNSQNLKYDAVDFLKKVDLSKVIYMHMAGHFVEQDGWIVDTHGSPVIDPVWDLLKQTFALLPESALGAPICLERDFNFPAIDELMKELNKIREIKSPYTEQQSSNKFLNVGSQ